MSTPEESGITSLGPLPPEEELRHHLAGALNKTGYSNLCLDDEQVETPALGPTWAGFFVMFGLVVSFALGARLELDLSLGWFVASLVVLTTGVLIIGNKGGRAFNAVLLLWLGLAVLLAIQHGLGGLLSTYGLAIGLAVALSLLVRFLRNGLGIDARALIRSIPLLFPLVLLLLFAPLVTADLWRVSAAASGPRLAFLSLLVLVPLVLVLIGRLIGSLPSVIRDTGLSLAKDPNSTHAVNVLIEKTSGKYAASWVSNNGHEILQKGFDTSRASEFAPYLAEVARPPLRKSVVVRTAVMLGGLGVCVFAYLYALSIILVPKDVARDWSHSGSTHLPIEVLGLHASIPADPYLGVTALLSIVALGAFLAFLTVEEAYSRAMAGALLHEPVNDFMLIALPYARLRERVILGEAPTGQSGPLAVADASLGGGPPTK